MPLATNTRRVNASVRRSQFTPMPGISDPYGAGRLSPEGQQAFNNILGKMGPPRKQLPYEVLPTTTYDDLPSLWASDNPNDFWSNILVDQCTNETYWATDEEYGAPVQEHAGGDSFSWHKLTFNCDLLREMTYRGVPELQEFRRERFHGGMEQYGIAFEIGHKELLTGNTKDIVTAHWESISERSRSTLEYLCIRAFREAGIDSLWASLDDLMPFTPTQLDRWVSRFEADIGAYHKQAGGVEKLDSQLNEELRSNNVAMNMTIYPAGTNQSYRWGDPYKFWYFAGGSPTIKTPKEVTKDMLPNWQKKATLDLMPHVRNVESHAFPVRKGVKDDPLMHPSRFAEHYLMPTGEELFNDSLSLESDAAGKFSVSAPSKYRHSSSNVLLFSSRANGPAIVSKKLSFERCGLIDFKQQCITPAGMMMLNLQLDRPYGSRPTGATADQRLNEKTLMSFSGDTCLRYLQRTGAYETYMKGVASIGAKQFKDMFDKYKDTMLCPTEDYEDPRDFDDRGGYTELQYSRSGRRHGLMTMRPEEQQIEIGRIQAQVSRHTSAIGSNLWTPIYKLTGGLHQAVLSGRRYMKVLTEQYPIIYMALRDSLGDLSNTTATATGGFGISAIVRMLGLDAAEQFQNDEKTSAAVRLAASGKPRTSVENLFARALESIITQSRSNFKNNIPMSDLDVLGLDQFTSAGDYSPAWLLSMFNIVRHNADPARVELLGSLRNVVTRMRNPADGSGALNLAITPGAEAALLMFTQGRLNSWIRSTRGSVSGLPESFANAFQSIMRSYGSWMNPEQRKAQVKTAQVFVQEILRWFISTKILLAITTDAQLEAADAPTLNKLHVFYEHFFLDMNSGTMAGERIFRDFWPEESKDSTWDEIETALDADGFQDTLLQTMAQKVGNAGRGAEAPPAKRARHQVHETALQYLGEREDMRSVLEILEETHIHDSFFMWMFAHVNEIPYPCKILLFRMKIQLMTQDVVGGQFGRRTANTRYRTPLVLIGEDAIQRVLKFNVTFYYKPIVEQTENVAIRVACKFENLISGLETDVVDIVARMRIKSSLSSRSNDFDDLDGYSYGPTDADIIPVFLRWNEELPLVVDFTGHKHVRLCRNQPEQHDYSTAAVYRQILKIPGPTHMLEDIVPSEMESVAIFNYSTASLPGPMKTPTRNAPTGSSHYGNFEAGKSLLGTQQDQNTLNVYLGKQWLFNEGTPFRSAGTM